MNALGWLSALIFLPLLSGMIVLLVGRSNREFGRALAIGAAFLSLALCLLLWLRFPSGAPGFEFEEMMPWAPAIGLNYHLAVDGLSMLMLLLSAIVVLFSLVASRSNPNHGHVYFAVVLFLEAGLFGTFSALNFLHWFLFWELSLIPAFFLVRLWGGPGRAAASMQFFLYTMVGSIALLLAFLALYGATGTFEFPVLADLGRSGALANSLRESLHWSQHSSEVLALIVFWAAFLGFAVKTPVFPFHTWLPATYSEASSETTMLLTGAMSKMGIYGFLRILLPIFPHEMQRSLTPLLWLAVASIVFPAFAAWRQTDLKRIFAYSSINHLGYCVLGVCVCASYADSSVLLSARSAALTGVFLQIFSHAITAATIFWFLAFIERRSGGLHGLHDFGGLRKAAPILCGLMGITTFASLGLPGLSGFPGEFLIFRGVFPLASWAATLSLLGLLLTAIFLLTMLQQVFSGPARESSVSVPFHDLQRPEWLIFAPAIALIFIIGIYPQWISGKVHATVLQLAGVGTPQLHPVIAQADAQAAVSTEDNR